LLIQEYYEILDVIHYQISTHFDKLQDLFCESALQPELHYMVDVALTLPVTSSHAERAFSKLCLINSHLSTTMFAERLLQLLRISANKTSSTLLVVVDAMVQKFCCIIIMYIHIYVFEKCSS
jgi:hypothetical protein